MIPIKLLLSGFLSYQDSVEVDFTTFDLACISGSNGAGKSSLLDAITWALFGQARRRDDALINSHANAAEVVFDFRYENNLYRVQRSKQREKTTALEFFICTDEGAWKPLTEKSLRETDNRIEATLRMDYDTFTNASFLLQGKADQFAQQRPGDRKRVLSAILGLEVWETYRANTAERRKGEEVELKATDAQIEEIDAELAQEAKRKERLAEYEARLEQLNQMRNAREEILSAMRRQAAVIEEQRRMVDVLYRSAEEARLRCERLVGDLENLKSERTGYLSILEGEAEVTAAYQRWQELRAALERWDGIAANFREVEARRSGPLTAIASDASRLEGEQRTLFSQEQAVLREQARLPEIEVQFGEVTSSLKRVEAQVSGRAALEADLQSIQSSAADAGAENRSLKEAMANLKERINRLTQVEGAVCPLCGQQLAEHERAVLIENLNAEGKLMGDRYRANADLVNQVDARVSELRASIAALVRAEAELRELARQADRLDSDRARILQAVEVWNAGGSLRLVEIKRMLVEQDFAHEARAALEEIDSQSRALGYDAAAHDTVRAQEVAARESEAGLRALESARASLAPLERQIAGMEEQVSQEAARYAEQQNHFEQARARYEEEAARLPDINRAEMEVFELQSEENRLRMDVGMVRQQVAVLDTQRQRRTRLSSHRDELTLQIARLKTLERAFSKDGVPALLIEQALPEIETQANDLLDRLSNGLMSIRFETQRQYKDKNRDDRRETLDIIISDAAGPREYEMFSGGEAFRVNFAIRLALSRVLAQRAGARLQTLVVDEGFGSQDADGRQRLIEAINMVRPEFKKILVITHMEELKEAFPARIEVEKTQRGSRVRVMT